MRELKKNNEIIAIALSAYLKLSVLSDWLIIKR